MRKNFSLTLRTLFGFKANYSKFILSSHINSNRKLEDSLSNDTLTLATEKTY
jgi:hypothetical protein